MTILVFFLALLIGASSAFAADLQYVASEPLAIKAMLDAAEVTPADTLYDLGSGDGRIVIAAAKRGANAVGIEIDPAWVKKSRAAIKGARLENHARIVLGDFFKTPLKDASVVTLFLPQTTTNLLETILRGLKPGTRIISNGVSIGKWTPREAIDVHQTMCNPKGCWEAPLFLWVI